MIIEPMNNSAPIVPILKPDNSVRLCGYYKLTTSISRLLPQYCQDSAKSRATTEAKSILMGMEEMFKDTRWTLESRRFCQNFFTFLIISANGVLNKRIHLNRQNKLFSQQKPMTPKENSFIPPDRQRRC